MGFLSLSLLLVAAGASIGLALDQLTLSRQNEVMKNKLEESWIWLADLDLHNVPDKTAIAYLSIKELIFGKLNFSVWFFIRAILVSLILTTAFYFIGKYLAILIPSLIIGDEPMRLGEVAPVLFEMYSTHANKAAIYSLNAAFDYGTLLATTLLVIIFLKNRSWHKRVAILIVDLAICLALFYTCLYLIMKSDVALDPQVGLLGFGSWAVEHFSNSGHAVAAFWLIPPVMYCATIFYPTFIYLILALIILLSYFSFNCARLVAMQLFEVSVVEGKSIFFVLGTFFGLILAILQVLVVIISKIPLTEFINWIGVGL